MNKIGFIGVGVMGKPMVLNLVKAGYQVTIFTRSKNKVEDLIKQGIEYKDSIKECCKNQDVIMTMVGYPSDVEQVYLSSNGIINSVKKGTLLIDFTTSSPKLSSKIYNEAKIKRLDALDAPVSGGDKGAKAGTLSIMVGGDKEAYNKALEYFKVLGSTVNYTGKAGMGQHTKLANQIVIAGTIASVVEAIHYARVKGLDTNILMNCISSGAAGSWQLTNNGKAILDNNYQPGFYIKHFIKDMKIAKDEMELDNTTLEVLNKVLSMYESLNEDDLGTQALIKYYE